MSTIDQSRLLQMRSTILSQNGALQRAAGRGVDTVEAVAQAPFAKTMTDALQGKRIIRILRTRRNARHRLGNGRTPKSLDRL
jgi:hypothetical protein